MNYMNNCMFQYKKSIIPLRSFIESDMIYTGLGNFGQNFV